MALGRGEVSPEPLPQPRTVVLALGRPPHWARGAQGTHSPHRHEKEDLWQVKGDVCPEIGLVEGGDGLWARRRVRIRDHTCTPALAPAPCPALPLLLPGPPPFIPNTSQLPSTLLEGDREREEEEEGRRQEEGWREGGR